MKMDKWQQRARQLKIETYAIYLAAKDRRVPWYAKVLIALVVSYAFSPVDLIPDFIPVLGYLDDLVLVPLGVTLALKLIPPEVMVDCRAQAQTVVGQEKPTSRAGAAVIVALWLLGIALIISIVVRSLRV